MWSYKFTSELSICPEESRVGLHLNGNHPANKDLFAQSLRWSSSFVFDAVSVTQGIGKAFTKHLERHAQRKNLFVGLEVSPSSLARATKLASTLGCNYFDVVLLSWPALTQGERRDSTLQEQKMDLASFITSWKKAQDLLKGQTVRHLGVSDFHIWQLESLLAQSGVKPDMLVVSGGPSAPKRRLVNYCHACHIDVAFKLNVEGIDKSSKRVDQVNRVAEEKRMSPNEVITHHCLERGLVVLHTAATLSSKALPVAEKPPNRMLHPFNKRPPFYAPHDHELYHHKLSEEDMALLDAMDDEPEPVKASKRQGIEHGASKSVSVKASEPVAKDEGEPVRDGGELVKEQPRSCENDLQEKAAGAKKNTAGSDERAQGVGCKSERSEEEFLICPEVLPPSAAVPPQVVKMKQEAKEEVPVVKDEREPVRDEGELVKDEEGQDTGGTGEGSTCEEGTLPPSAQGTQQEDAREHGQVTAADASDAPEQPPAAATAGLDESGLLSTFAAPWMESASFDDECLPSSGPSRSSSAEDDFAITLNF